MESQETASMKELLTRMARVLGEPKHLKLRLFVEGLIIGSLTGLVIALFRYLLILSENFLPRLYSTLAAMPIYLIFWLILLCFIAWILGKIVTKDPMTAGSGIPQIEGILAGEMQMNWARVLALKFLGAVLGIGAGLSLGREGPSVQLGACLGSGVSRLTHRAFDEGRYLLVTGAGAGLAAAFNAPLAGAVFAFEELAHTFSPYVLIGAMSAAIMATTVTQQFFGMAPVFHLGEIPAVDAGANFFLLVSLGLFVGVVSLAFNRFLIFFLERNRRFSVPAWGKALLPLFISVPLGFFLPEVLGGGSPLVDSLVTAPHAILFLVVLFLGKFFFTMVAFGSGVPGGIFLPMLVLGALAGNIFAAGAESFGVLPASFAVCAIVYAMAGYFSAVVKSPITGVILIMEMTGSFAHLLPLMIVSMVAYIVADLTGGRPVYEMLLARNIALQKKAASAYRARLAEKMGTKEVHE